MWPSRAWEGSRKDTYNSLSILPAQPSVADLRTMAANGNPSATQNAATFSGVVKRPASLLRGESGRLPPVGKVSAPFKLHDLPFDPADELLAVTQGPRDFATLLQDANVDPLIRQRVMGH